MRKNFKKVATVAIIAVATIVTAITFQSCSQETDSVSPSETKLTTEQAFANDLQKLADAQRKFAKQLTANAFSRRAGEVPTDSLGIPDDCQEAAQEVAEIIGEIVQNYELTEDLTEHEKEGLTIDEETREIMCLDHEAFLAYAEEYKSEEYYNIIVSMLQNQNFHITVEDVVHNDNLKMNEKLNLVAKAALDEYVIETLPSEPEPSGPEGLWKVSCEGQFNFEKLLCDFVFITEVTAATSAAAAATSATAAASTPAVTPALLTSYASFAAQWYLCQNSANNNYKACVKERQGK